MNFRIINEHGNRMDMSFRELMVYLYCAGLATVDEIQKKIFEKCDRLNISSSEITRSIKMFEQANLIQYKENKVELHVHYSFNSDKIYKTIIEKNDRSILSLGKIELSMTDQCPFECSYCSKKNHAMKTNYLSFDEKKELVLDAYNLGALTLTLTGGEPLHESIIGETIELVKYAKKIGFYRVVILTSGFGVKENFNAISESGVDEIQISYNGIKKYHEDKVRNEFIESNIENIVKLRDYGIKVGVCAVLTKESMGKIQEIVEFCISNRIVSVYFYPVMPVGSAEQVWKDIRLDVNELEIAIKEIKGMKEIYKDVLYISFPQSFLIEKDVKQICEGGLYTVYISEAGFVTVCACAPLSNENIRQRKLAEIWDDSLLFGRFREITEVDAECSKCAKRSLCLNSCVFRNEAATFKNKNFFYDKCKRNNIVEINKIG